MSVNAWLNLEAMEHCLTLCDCRVVLLDAERANQLKTSNKKMIASGVVGILVYRSSTPPLGMRSFDDAISGFAGSTMALPSVKIDPEDHATILFTSG